ncbi:hypothetical protein OH76DRAFT_1354154, partial [Lentinus brumalis]
LRKWLGFPTTSELLSAYFVLHLVDVCGGNLNVLLLRGVWRPYKEIKAASSSSSKYLDRQSGLNAIVDFLCDLLPLAHGEEPTTAIQQLVTSDADRFSPFRNLAPTRSVVMGSEGPYHPANVRKPGAFASCVINRALTFNTPAVKSHGNPTLFSNEGEWEAFKVARNFVNNEPQSMAYFFNMTCYGTAQGTRYNGMRDIDVYFAAEGDWNKLLLDCGGKVPFTRFFKWAKQQSRLPQVGMLTAFLLAADLSYSGVVEPPSTEEVGVIIHKNHLGSLSGLVDTGQVSGKDASQEEVVRAFQELLEYLQETITQEDQDLIGLDAIMVEHLLCKFQRVRRELPSFKGKAR